MQIKYLVVHHSASPRGRGDNAETIHRWHQNRNPPFDLIGYHKVILDDGEIENGRPEYCTGAHVQSYNYESLGVCLIGEEDFTKSQLAALRLLLDGWVIKYPEAKVVGHNYLDTKTRCPNFNVSKWYNGDE